MSSLASGQAPPKKQSFHATNVVRISIFIHRSNFLVFKWNELVAGFRAKIELKKYRRNYFTPTYEQCFTSSDAVQCMINVLKSHPNFETKPIEKFVRICFIRNILYRSSFSDITPFVY